jgi:hypothetical protein
MVLIICVNVRRIMLSRGAVQPNNDPVNMEIAGMNPLFLGPVVLSREFCQ